MNASAIPPEVQGALNLARRHEDLASAWSWRQPAGQRINQRHQSKAQKLRRRASVLLAGQVKGGCSEGR